MKRREFIKQGASAAGLTFVACGLGGLAACAVSTLAELLHIDDKA